jgi:hypothetical protein
VLGAIADFGRIKAIDFVPKKATASMAKCTPKTNKRSPFSAPLSTLSRSDSIRDEWLCVCDPIVIIALQLKQDGLSAAVASLSSPSASSRIVSSWTGSSETDAPKKV